MGELLDKDGLPVIATGSMKERLAAALKHAHQIPYPGMERLFTPREALSRFLWQSKGWRDLWEERVDHFLAACDALKLIVEDEDRKP